MLERIKNTVSHINPKLISSAIMLIVSGSLLVAISFAWFSKNKEVSVGTMTVSVEDKRITLGDSITVVRRIGTDELSREEYRSEGNGNDYYLYRDGSFAVDENGDRIPVALKSLLPGESVEVSFSYTCTDSLLGDRVEFYFNNIMADGFNEQNLDGTTGAYHSVLGVYTFSFDPYGDGSFSTPQWIVEAEPGVDDVVPTSVKIGESVWEGEEGSYVSAAFCLEFNLDRYYALNTSTNQLSEKSFTIGSFRIGVNEDE